MHIYLQLMATCLLLSGICIYIYINTYIQTHTCIRVYVYTRICKVICICIYNAMLDSVAAPRVLAATQCKHCNTLQCTAKHCNTLQHTTTHCTHYNNNTCNASPCVCCGATYSGCNIQAKDTATRTQHTLQQGYLQHTAMRLLLLHIHKLLTQIFNSQPISQRLQTNIRKHIYINISENAPLLDFSICSLRANAHAHIRSHNIYQIEGLHIRKQQSGQEP